MAFCRIHGKSSNVCDFLDNLYNVCFHFHYLLMPTKECTIFCNDVEAVEGHDPNKIQRSAQLGCRLLGVGLPPLVVRHVLFCDRSGSVVSLYPASQEQLPVTSSRWEWGSGQLASGDPVDVEGDDDGEEVDVDGDGVEGTAEVVVESVLASEESADSSSLAGTENMQLISDHKIFSRWLQKHKIMVHHEHQMRISVIEFSASTRPTETKCVQMLPHVHCLEEVSSEIIRQCCASKATCCLSKPGRNHEQAHWAALWVLFKFIQLTPRPASPHRD